MATELDAASMAAVVRARQVAQVAALLEQARGRRTWKSIFVGACLIAGGAAFVAWAKVSVQACVGFMLLCGMAGWVESHTARRLDAIVKLVEGQQNG